MELESRNGELVQGGGMEEAEENSKENSEDEKDIFNSKELSNEIFAQKDWKDSSWVDCRDKFKNCNVVVQSRLCRYQCDIMSATLGQHRALWGDQK